MRKERVVVARRSGGARNREGRARQLPAEAGRAPRSRRLRAQQAGNRRRLANEGFVRAQLVKHRVEVVGPRTGRRSILHGTPARAIASARCATRMRSFQINFCSATRRGARASSIRPRSCWSCSRRWSMRTTSPRSRSRRISSTPRMRRRAGRRGAGAREAHGLHREPLRQHRLPGRARKLGFERRWLNKRGHKLSWDIQYSPRACRRSARSTRYRSPGRRNRTSELRRRLSRRGDRTPAPRAWRAPRRRR